MLLDPNRDSTVKVTGYSFSFSPVASLVLGTASSLGTFTQQPSTSIKGRRVLTNAPVPGFVLLTALQIANVNVFVGTTEDAFTYNAGAQNVIMDLPRLDPQNRATASGSYTGALPAGYTAGSAYQFVITLQGPSTLAGGYGQ
jgi:predicted MFS family arabinose efflux permease